MLNRFEELDNKDFDYFWEHAGDDRPKPKLTLNPEKTNFYDMTIDDFIMENYDPIKPQLKLELGI